MTKIFKSNMGKIDVNGKKRVIYENRNTVKDKNRHSIFQKTVKSNNKQSVLQQFEKDMTSTSIDTIEYSPQRKK